MKKLLSVLLAIIIVSSVVLSLPISVGAESLYIRKIVSVVYDDSGSMLGDKWAYANYAMQSFCGMLNSEDQLYITYMSRSTQYTGYSPEKIDLSAGGIKNSVESIRTHKDSWSTPYGAVKTAFDKLKTVNDANPNTQYWLVVITDGDFDECTEMTTAQKKGFLNDKFNEYTESIMPNGTKPQVTFLGIGGVVFPDEDKDKGIFTHAAKNADGIIGEMSKMADRISGRTRLQADAVKKIDDKTVQVSSTIPLLNIAVFVQGSQAKITKAAYSNQTSIPIDRNVSLSYPGYSDLVGGAFLVGDSQNILEAGTYHITFDGKVDLSDVIVLFEPALEMRMAVTVNGKELSDSGDFADLMEGDSVSVSCKICEMGTDTEVDPSLMPPGTKFEITVLEDGKIAKQTSGKDMQLSDYVLKNTDTEITASLIIDGFNPISHSAKFTPQKYVPRVVYSMTSDYGSDVRNVKLDHIATNKDLSVCFTVLADGVAITDPAAVRALNPVISVSPSGNDGVVSYSGDGKIVFTPNEASKPLPGVGSFDVDVTCTLENGISATQVYTVLISTYQVIPVDADQPVKKTELYDNQTSVSFYITKDGVKLGKAEVEDHILVLLNEEHSTLKTDVAVAQDGTITVTPYSDEQHVLTFWNWWTNWAYYFGLEGKDVTVTLNHALGVAQGTVDVVSEDMMYLILNVYLPLIIELLLIAAVISYIIRYFTKARFASNGVLYVGSITLNTGTARTHRLELGEVRLSQYNTFKNLWNPFKELTVPVCGVSITAAKGNRIICNEDFPWYSDGIRPKAQAVKIDTPKDIVNYCQEHEELVIHEIKTACVMDEQNRVILQDDSVYYFVKADIDYPKAGFKKSEVIDSAIAFCYSTI